MITYLINAGKMGRIKLWLSLFDSLLQYIIWYFSLLRTEILRTLKKINIFKFSEGLSFGPHCTHLSPVREHLSIASIRHQLMGELRDLRIQVVEDHQHNGGCVLASCGEVPQGVSSATSERCSFPLIFLGDSELNSMLLETKVNKCSNITISDTCIVIHIREKYQQHAHFFPNNLFYLIFPRHVSTK